jgi:uncharacterized protein (TIGR02186 family)
MRRVHRLIAGMVAVMAGAPALAAAPSPSPPAMPAPLGSPGPLAPSTPGLAAAVAQETVRVTSTYRGETVTVFGVIPEASLQGADVIVTLRGPDQRATLHRRQRVAGLWINVDPVRLEAMPGFFARLSTRPVPALLAPAERDALGLDPAQAVRFVPALPPREAIVRRAALTRLKQTAGTWMAEGGGPQGPGQSGGLRLLGSGLFRADIALPVTAPPGVYAADILVVRSGRVVARTASRLEVVRVGVERSVHDFAHRFSFFHALATLALALTVGWAAHRIFNRP